jgi:hypothetical protein
VYDARRFLAHPACEPCFPRYPACSGYGKRDRFRGSSEFPGVSPGRANERPQFAGAPNTSRLTSDTPYCGAVLSRGSVCEHIDMLRDRRAGLTCVGGDAEW